MKKSVHKFIRNYQLLEGVRSVLIAVSGGPDSMAMLDFLWKNREWYNIRILAAHAHHQLREESADQDLLTVQNYCLEYNIPFFSKRLEVKEYAKANRMSTQLAARELRYKWLEKLTIEENVEALITAHHGDDQIETIMMKQVRGYIPIQAPGISVRRPFGNGYLIRPFLGITKAEIENYCNEEGILTRIDESNFSTKYTRNRYRQEILPFIKNENSQAHVQMQRQNQWLEDDSAFLMKLAESELNNILVQKKEAHYSISCDSFQSIHVSLQRRVITLILNYLNIDNSPFPASVHIEQVMSLIHHTDPSKQLHIGAGVFVYRDYNLCHFSRRKVSHETNTDSIEELVLPGVTKTAIGEIHSTFLEEDMEVREGRNQLILAYDEHAPLFIRTRLTGDRINPIGINGTKKISRLFIDRKISQSLREKWPLLLNKEGNILWVPLLMRARGVEPIKEKAIVLTMKPTEEIINNLNG
ncbi:tRNA lysidine(34) synthetase TilS [Alkalihalobacillus trypoxylicola]|uniref:tRNA(Ile)-lysidine synthase n=1 Tax=Alkalihalobacillus trypoxylicola TaxID=519424 RepID=A0A162ENB1_9BACI|nr:tRNA lysidine(34) synthetase TilS [Alkalihalobacillus trypoxylicola]KYG33317.1 hypothetical protein AZF04_17275 [Alkalihalobacillus trypoxylicola]